MSQKLSNISRDEVYPLPSQKAERDIFLFKLALLSAKLHVFILLRNV